jgi:hypothetical protein
MGENMKWFVSKNKFATFNGMIWFIPCISVYYNKHSFLETGITTPSLGIQLSWIKWAYGFEIQKGY